MKKTIIASSIAVAVLGSINARASITITNVQLGTANYAAGGLLTSSGVGTLASIDPLFGIQWTGIQQTIFMDNTGSWNGTTESGAYDYDSAISSITSNQVAVGMFFNWNGNNDLAILEIFDCVAGVCIGNGEAMDNGPFPGQIFIFSGTGSAAVTTVPVPASVWLLGSGLGLIGLARSKKS